MGLLKNCSKEAVDTMCDVLVWNREVEHRTVDTVMSLALPGGYEKETRWAGSTRTAAAAKSR